MSNEGTIHQALAKELEIATTALGEALAVAQSRFRTLLRTSVKDFTGDLVTDVDLLCEEKITSIIRGAFPEHAVILEESDDYQLESPWTWIVDPLDGTNNYAYGLPLWGISVTLCYDMVPVLACIAEGSTGTITTTVQGSGVRVDGALWPISRQSNPRASAAFWIGYQSDRTAKDTRDLLNTLSRRTRRIFENWAPTVDVGLFLRGGIDLIVGKQCSGTELPAALLILREAGASIVDLEGSDVRLEKIPEVFIIGRDPLLRYIANDLNGCLISN